MPPGDVNPRQLSQRYSWVVPVLSAIAGSVDAIGYLSIVRVYTSHISGDSVDVGVRVALGHWGDAWLHFAPILAFIVGILGGLALAALVLQANIERVFAIVVCAEIALLLALFIVARSPAQWMLVFPAMAMGVQNALLRSVGQKHIRTTYVSGMLTHAAHDLYEALASLIKRDGEAPQRFGSSAFYGGIWLSFLFGGMCGATLELRIRSSAVLLPMTALVALALVDCVSPVVKRAETGP